MGANDAKEVYAGDPLIPGLPEELVLAHVLPRLPWFTRPLCRALSKPWRATLDAKNPELDRRTRVFQVPLLRGLFLVCTYDKQIFIRDHAFDRPHRSDAYQIQPHWRKLPPLQGLIAPPPTDAIMVASSGMVYVWSGDARWSDREEQHFLLKLDIGCGGWTWNKLPVPHAFNYDAITFNSKIYAPGLPVRSSTGCESEKKIVLVHDMMTDECRQAETWNQDELRVLLKNLHSNPLEEMYSFVEQESDSKLEVLIYDQGSDSWRTHEELPIPECRWSHLPEVKLLNSDSFEPVPEVGTNVLWIDKEGEVISWINSSLENTWLDFSYNPVWEGGLYLEYIQFIRGSMYGIFIEDKEEKEDTVEEEDEGGLSSLSRRVLMKGRIVVASGGVAWEVVHEIGFFQESYSIGSSVIQPIDFYTVMA